ncbi:hypothetical protein EVAR_4031_1 [Eumeta japonica]|uniref:Uncharacterized protein n=1 Tax=Eumeta variegata TaxID=151549 RepID=A0A4C1T4X3_EUMVA|nr:hypothetical protein EVAR_4031_1 [Eumeta japonica]
MVTPANESPTCTTAARGLSCRSPPLSPDGDAVHDSRRRALDWCGGLRSKPSVRAVVPPMVTPANESPTCTRLVRGLKI